MKNRTKLVLGMAGMAGSGAVVMAVMGIESTAPEAGENDLKHGEWMETQLVRSQAREALRREPDMPAGRRDQLLKIANERRGAE